MLSNLTSGILWKIATGLAGVASLALGGMLISSNIENRAISKQRDGLTSLITDPKTGYVARLTEANTSIHTLKVSIETQNKAYASLSETSKRQLAESNRRLVLAQAQTKTMEKRLAGFMATKPQGATLEDRVRDIDSRVLTELKQ
jgi:hypothetical protein